MADRFSSWLVLAAVELLAVVKDVVVGGVEAGFHTVAHHLTGSRRALQFLHLSTRGHKSESEEAPRARKRLPCSSILI